MKSNDLLVKIKESRNIVVHKRMLAQKSKAVIGVFKFRKHKLGIEIPVSPFENSEYLLAKNRDFFLGKGSEIPFLDENHSSIGEEIGLLREWIIDEISDCEILSVCIEAYYEMCNILGEAHKLLGFELVASGFSDDFVINSRVITESDINPELHKIWGW